MRGFYFARKRVNGEVAVIDNEEVKAYPNAQLPEYQTHKSAGADFYCAEEVEVPSIWSGVLESIGNRLSNVANALIGNATQPDNIAFKPTIIHTGIKADMETDEVLELYNRSSNPGKLGLILANSVGVVDADYFNNVDNDGEIMFAFYNFMPWSVTVKVGDRIGQGVFKKYLRPVEGLRVKDAERVGGIGSTDSNNNVSLDKEVNN